MSEKEEIDFLAYYLKRVQEFKEEMRRLGIKVKVTASFGKYYSEVEEVPEDEQL